jgi:hypothetical protein
VLEEAPQGMSEILELTRFPLKTLAPVKQLGSACALG